MPEATTQQPTKTTTPPPDPDAGIMTGGPNGPGPEHGTIHPDLQNTQKTTTTTTTQKYEINGKTFASAEDMSKYVADLERKVVNQPNTQTKPALEYVSPTINSQRELIDGKPIEDVLFEDPTKVLKHLKNQVHAEIQQSRNQEQAVKSFWAKFYEENPDLKDKDDFVQEKVNANWQRGKNWDQLTPENLAKEVSTQARLSLKKLGLSNATEIPNNNAATLSSSGAAVGAPTNTPKAPTSFVDELGAFKKRRKA